MHAQDLLEQTGSTSRISDDVQRVVRLWLLGMRQRTKHLAREELDDLIGCFLIVIGRETPAFLMIVQMSSFRRRPSPVVLSKPIVVFGQLKPKIDFSIVHERLINTSLERAEIRIRLLAQDGGVFVVLSSSQHLRTTDLEPDMFEGLRRRHPVAQLTQLIDSAGGFIHVRKDALSREIVGAKTLGQLGGAFDRLLRLSASKTCLGIPHEKPVVFRLLDHELVEKTLGLPMIIRLLIEIKKTESQGHAAGRLQKRLIYGCSGKGEKLALHQFMDRFELLFLMWSVLHDDSVDRY